MYRHVNCNNTDAIHMSVVCKHMHPNIVCVSQHVHRSVTKNEFHLSPKICPVVLT